MKKLKSCLLIDDDEITNFINQQLIEEMSISEEVITIDDARLALKYIEENNAANGNNAGNEIIFLDLNMPGMDGFEFLEKFTTCPYSNKYSVFVVSSSNNHTDRQRAQIYNVDGYVPKPLTREKVLGILDKAK